MRDKRREEDVEQLRSLEEKNQREDARADEQQNHQQTNHAPHVIVPIARNREHRRTVQERAARARQIVANETLQQVLALRVHVEE